MGTSDVAAGGPAPLKGVRVLDFTQALSGPYASMTLADLGADVVKVEPPGRGDDSRHWGPPFLGADATYYHSVNRNKRSIVVDLKSEAGRVQVLRHAADVDVVIHNWRPGTAERLGLGYPEVSALNPRVVYCAISAYGSDRPDLAGYDQIVQGTTGVMTITGPVGQPTKWGVPVGDIATGMFASMGVLAALYDAARTGHGALVEVSMEDSLLAMLTHHGARQLVSDAPIPSTWNSHETIAPYGLFPTSDGHVNICVGNDDQFQRMCGALALEALSHDERFSTNPLRVRYKTDLVDALTAATLTRTTDDVVTALRAAGVPVGEVRNVAEALADPRVRDRGMVLGFSRSDIDHGEVVNTPIRIDGQATRLRLPPPRLGEHSEMSQEDA